MAITDKLTAIANGVRHVTGGTDTMNMAGMATNLMAVPYASDMTFTPTYTPPANLSWINSSWSEIAEALQMHYANVIDIHDYFNVGDTRTVHLNAMDATGVGESHVAQDVELVLISADHYDMTDGSGKAAFVWGLKDSLAETGYMESTNTNANGWHESARRNWCQDVFKAALPNAFQSLLKQVNIVTATKGNARGTTTSADYIFLPAEKEVFGVTTYANADDESTLTQYKWYETATNRIKKKYGSDSGSANSWWERSPRGSNATYFCYVDYGGSANHSNASYASGLAPHGCI